MTKEETAECIKVMQAYANGEIIEEKRFSFDSTEWVESIDPSWQWYKFDYRIKPRPKYRPFKNVEECWKEMLKHEPFGWIKCRGCYFNIVAVTDVYAYLSEADGSAILLASKNSYNDNTFADGAPFGVKED